MDVIHNELDVLWLNPRHKRAIFGSVRYHLGRVMAFKKIDGA